MKNQLTQLNILGLSPNAIKKIFTLLEDKDLLRFREICHAAKDKVDTSILDIRKMIVEFGFTYKKDDQDVQINFDTYFNVVGNRSYTFLRIAMIKIRAELPIITIKAHEEDRRNFDLQITLKLENLKTFLDRFGQHIAGVIWKDLCLYEATPDNIRTCAEFFNGKRVDSVRASTMEMNNSNYSAWLTLIRNVNAAEFSCCISVLTKDDYKFVIDLSENVYCASINFLEMNFTLVSIVKDMFSRKCVYLDLDYSYFTLSDVESLIAFFNRSEKKISLHAFTYVAPFDVQIGAYYVGVYEWPPPNTEGNKTLVIEPIEDREQN